LSDLTKSYIFRKLFKSFEFRSDISIEKIKELEEKTKQIASHKGLDANYYAGIEQSSSKPYEPYEITDNKTSKAIFIKQKNGKIKELSEISDLVKALSKKSIVKTCLVFSPLIEDDIYSIKGIQELFI
jgi:HD superfamily phosphohydrolase